MATETQCCSSKSWHVINGRPDSVPECQNTSCLPHLGPEETSCENNGSEDKCFYFKCRTCMSLLALDHYNPDYKEKIEYIPRIGSIKSRTRGLFEDHPGYHGELIDFYGSFLSQIEELNGIAVHSWNSQHAQLLFDGVEKTFEKSQFAKSKSFEIDWIVFLRGTLNVFEVGRRNTSNACTEKVTDSSSVPIGDNAGAEIGSGIKGMKDLIYKKIEQIIKDYLIVQHLLNAAEIDLGTICQNYFIVLPNLPIEDIKGQLEARKRQLDELISPNCKM